ncbi:MULTISPECIES: ABC transporter permease [Paenibacillus]|uniref:ABC transporter permease n=1 Tax=Paenibacillus naphthalenovorans TaxID=162209 RepID=A0A0U2N0E9_9BACL|nr:MULTISPECIES: ABC transporter permease [Paenibacillus]ALS24335.1 ABC transporter permease [Paenibacillus naphthalenovorans]NTZ20439.1 ABC transporter permease [Paenibacillus sp. JMULE4]GCL73773.1 ABC transporter permease [Paenibacillus naphthalenovorans]SDI54268.1 NitT/TauT family transport system permease protein [Paenibacillus naphthalenovorans]
MGRFIRIIRSSADRSLGIILFLLVWELLPTLGIVNKAFLSPPSSVVVSITKLFSTGNLWVHVFASLQRSLSGLLLAIVAGTLLGLFLGWFKRFEAIVDPLLQLFRQISAFALFPVFILFLGIGETSKTAIILWASFWPILLNTVSGVKYVDKLLIDSAKSMGGSQSFLFFRVILPAAAPSIFTGIRLGGAYCITALVAAEMIGSSAGLGFYILNSQEIFQIPDMYAGIIVLAFLGLLLNYILAVIEARFTRWKKGLSVNA